MYQSEHFVDVLRRNGYTIILDEEKAMSRGCLKNMSSHLFRGLGYVDNGYRGLSTWRRRHCICLDKRCQPFNCKTRRVHGWGERVPELAWPNEAKRHATGMTRQECGSCRAEAPSQLSYVDIPRKQHFAVHLVTTPSLVHLHKQLFSLTPRSSASLILPPSAIFTHHRYRLALGPRGSP